MFTFAMGEIATTPDGLPLDRLRRLSADEYLGLAAQGWFGDEKVELVHGLVLTMSPQGDSHAALVRRLINRLVRQLDDRYEVSPQLPLVLARLHVPEPDVAVIERISGMRHPRSALLVIEVAASSLRYDRNTKLPIYAAANIAEYWIVDVEAQLVEVYREPSGAGYRELARLGVGDRLRPPGLPTVDLAIADLFADA